MKEKKYSLFQTKKFLPTSMQCCLNYPDPRSCRDCARTFCPPCFETQHAVVGGDREQQQLLCWAHGRLLEYRCDLDDARACSLCSILGPHEGHALTPFWFTAFHAE